MPEPTVAVPSSPPKSKGQVFLVRLGSTLVLWTLIGIALTMRLDWVLVVIVSLLGLLGTWEYFRLQTADPEARDFTRLAVLVAALYWGATASLSIPGKVEPPWWLDAAALVLTLHGAFYLTFRKALDGVDTLRRIQNLVFGMVYTTLLGGFMTRILFFEGAESGRHLLLMFVMVTKFGDMGAYAFGSLFGKHKMIPHISPAKTWQGFGGAIFGSYVAMAAMMLIVPEKLVPLTWGHAMVLALLLSITGVAGDLAESVLKRCHHIKDSGHKLPGIGGILDLTDSLLFTAPVAYCYLKAIS
jgi:phosphatidate cytidylyltransferase